MLARRRDVDVAVGEDQDTAAMIGLLSGGMAGQRRASGNDIGNILDEVTDD